MRTQKLEMKMLDDFAEAMATQVYEYLTKMKIILLAEKMREGVEETITYEEMDAFLRGELKKQSN